MTNPNTQTLVIDAITEMFERIPVTVAKNGAWANTGTLVVVDKGTLATVATLKYDFQQEYASLDCVRYYDIADSPAGATVKFHLGFVGRWMDNGCTVPEVLERVRRWFDLPGDGPATGCYHCTCELTPILDDEGESREGPIGALRCSDVTCPFSDSPQPQPMPAHPHVTISSWDRTDGGIDLLYGTVIVNGVHFHANAYRVHTNEDGVQEAYQYDDDLAAIHAAVSADGHWETIDIDGEPYVVILEPYCS